MIHLTDLAGITVEGFWQDCNWFDRPPKAEALSTFAQEESDWSKLEVAEFFARANWSGRTAIAPPSTHSGEPLSLTTAVSEYFQSLPWWGASAQAATPGTKRANPSPPPMTEPSRDFNANDLSNLF
jgi:hypothetical protein